MKKSIDKLILIKFILVIMASLYIFLAVYVTENEIDISSFIIPLISAILGFSLAHLLDEAIWFRKIFKLPWCWQLKKAMIKDGWRLDEQRVWVHIRRNWEGEKKCIDEITDEMIASHAGSGIPIDTIMNRLRSELIKLWDANET